MKKIVILCTLDTKGEQVSYLRDKIEARGHKAILMDLSTGGIPPFEAEVTPVEIASLAGKEIEHLRSSKERSVIIDAMIDGAQKKVLEIFSQGELDGILTFGGATMALMGSRIMQKLPFGVPKVIAVPDILPTSAAAWFDAMDVTVMQMIIEIAGMNDLVKNAIECVAGAIVGMVETRSYSSLNLPYPSIAMSEFGFSLKCARLVDKILSERGYHIFSYHAQGLSDSAMEKFIAQGFFNGVIETAPAGLIEELFLGNRAAGMDRLDAAAARGIPQVLAPGGVNITGCGHTRRNREEYASRSRILKVDGERQFTRYNIKELKTAAKVYAEKLNKSNGPVKFLIPLRGWNSIDKEGSILHDPEEDKVFVAELRKHLKPEIEIREIDCHIEDPEFARAMAETFDEIFKSTS